MGLEWLAMTQSGLEIVVSCILHFNQKFALRPRSKREDYASADVEKHVPSRAGWAACTPEPQAGVP